VICDKFITVLALSLHLKIVAKIKDANYEYFVLSIDYTPKIVHIGQLNVIIRYCACDVQVMERFLGYIPP
jgi:hypothetical protein